MLKWQERAHGMASSKIPGPLGSYTKVPKDMHELASSLAASVTPTAGQRLEREQNLFDACESDCLRSLLLLLLAAHFI